MLIFIPLYIYVIAWYNHQVVKLEGWQGQGGDWIGRHLHPLPLPSRSMILLISTILLAVASTLYTVSCPTRVQEFSRDVWHDQLNRSLLHYWPFAWRHRRRRIVCGVCYLVGAGGVLFVLGTKVFTAGVYIWENSPGLR